MQDSLFKGIFDTEMTKIISVSDFLLCIGCALLIGLILASAYMCGTKYTKSFVAALALLPAVVCVIIMMVNGNVGTGVAVAGAFSLVRFRSVPGSAREIGAIFLAMCSGLVAGMGYLAYALLTTVILGAAMLVYNRMDFETKKNCARYKTLHITIPEDLDYSGVFDQILQTYACDYEVVQIKKQAAIFFLITVMLLSGCSRKYAQTKTTQNHSQTADPANTGNTTDTSDPQNSAAVEIDTSDLFSGRDKEIGYDETESVSIQLSDQSTSCTSDAVKISGNTVTITDEGTYVLSGNLTDGMVVVEAEDTDKVQLVLQNAQITNAQSAALYIRCADKVFVTLAPETQNSLQNGGAYTAIDENQIDAAVFSKSDLTFNGEGMLTVTADAGHGIVSKDDLVFTSGDYAVTGADHGIVGKDSVRIANGAYKIVAGKDGIHAENKDDASLGFIYLENGTYDIKAQGDGISAGSWLQAEGGTYNITTREGSANVKTKTEPGRGSFHRQMAERRMEDTASAQEADATEDTASMKGIKAGTQMVLKKGAYTMDCEDDALHSNGNLTISAGTYTLSSGDDGIHADCDVTIDGGRIDITRSYEGIEGLGITITDGEISVQAADDGINAAGGNDSSGFEGPGSGGDQFAAVEGAYIHIAGGTLDVNAFGDGIDSNGDLTVSGGETYVSGPTDNGNGSLDYNGTAQITGGIFAASGSSGMAQNFGSSSTQGVVMVSLDAQEAETKISLTDSAGQELLSWTAQKEYTSVIVSCPEIKQGETYKITAGTAAEQIVMDRLVYGNGTPAGAEAGRGARGGMRGEPGKESIPGQETPSGEVPREAPQGTEQEL
ncbi:MAG: carbohydrate-binding domain-containing protein [Eubacterium sp.]|nr:carbohydrate-binding domain-containing protein [Eubacterium sp.]